MEPYREIDPEGRITGWHYDGREQTGGGANCPLCALGNNANKVRIYKFDEMDADHVTAWSKGGATTLANCEMLCKTHNRSKGNR